jgi:uncharacterized repeat protein (TIGR03806 family)
MRHRLLIASLGLAASLLAFACAADPAPRIKPFLNMPTTREGAIPKHLSDVGAFSDVKTLRPAPGLVPYELNVSFWSDGAYKQRWVGVPAGSAITFSPTGEWKFPAGTVFVKHFEFAPDASRPETRRRLETRVLVVCDDRADVYGVTYKWRPDGSDADLFTGDMPVTEPIAPGIKQDWYYPARADCMMCHTPNAGGVLGPKTRQINRNVDGSAENQLLTWSRLGLLTPAVDAAQIPHLARLAAADDETKPIQDRARSYLDANCAQCHRPGGVAGNFDARYDTPLDHQNLIDGPVLITLGLDRARLIAPHDVWRSVLLARVETQEQTKMPPLAHQVVDREGATLLRHWIESLPGPNVLEPPTLEPKGGEFSGRSVKVTLRHPDTGVTLRYTLDGSVPTSSSPAYTHSLELTSPTTLRAKAFKPGSTRSITVQETYIVGDQ